MRSRVSALVALLLIVVMLLPASGLAAAGDTNFTNVVTSNAITAGTTSTVGTFLVLSKATPVTVTAGMAIAPLASYQPITASGTITNATLSTTGIATGTLLRLVNTSSNSITVLEGTTAQTASTSVALGQYDSAMFLFDGTYWIEMAGSDN